MYEVFADLHVHIGRSENGKPIKITAARSLNFANIAKECADRKGINIVGIIDCASPYVIEDIENFLKTGEAYEIEDGGIIYKDKVCILLGSEVETSEVGRNGKCGAAHNVCFFPHLSDIKGFSKEMSRHIHNITLSTQRSDVSGYELIDIVEKYNGILIPAHCFTPFKSYYGNCTDRLQNIFKEIQSDLGAPIPTSGNLTRWANQGVLLLNATLTVRAHQAGSHQRRGWEEFTDAAIRTLAEQREHLVFILWGAYAQKKGAFIDREKHLVLTSVHPSPLSAYHGFFGNKHFSRANAYLIEHGETPINW